MTHLATTVAGRQPALAEAASPPPACSNKTTTRAWTWKRQSTSPWASSSRLLTLRLSSKARFEGSFVYFFWRWKDRSFSDQTGQRHRPVHCHETNWRQQILQKGWRGKGILNVLSGALTTVFRKRRPRRKRKRERKKPPPPRSKLPSCTFLFRSVQKFIIAFGPSQSNYLTCVHWYIFRNSLVSLSFNSRF